MQIPLIAERSLASIKRKGAKTLRRKERITVAIKKIINYEERWKNFFSLRLRASAPLRLIEAKDRSALTDVCS